MNCDAENITAARLRHEATSAAARVVAATSPAEADSHAAESDSNVQSDSAAKSSLSTLDSRAAHTSASDQKRGRQVRLAAASKLRAQKQRRQVRRDKDSAQNALTKTVRMMVVPILNHAVASSCISLCKGQLV